MSCSVTSKNSSGISSPVTQHKQLQTAAGILLRKRHTHPFNGPLSGTTRVSRYQKAKNQSGFYWSKRQWVAVASAGPYASLHLAPDRYHASIPPLSFFYRPDALPAAQPTVSKHWRHLLHTRHGTQNELEASWRTHLHTQMDEQPELIELWFHVPLDTK